MTPPPARQAPATNPCVCKHVRAQRCIDLIHRARQALIGMADVDHAHPSLTLPDGVRRIPAGQEGIPLTIHRTSIAYHHSIGEMARQMTAVDGTMATAAVRVWDLCGASQRQHVERT